MRAVLLEVPEHLLAERRRLGLDHRDEMWEGELHMLPPASEHHQRRSGLLIAALVPLASPLGLRVAPEIGIFDPAVGDPISYRVPDVAVYRPEAATVRGIEGAAELAVEIRSPGDESLDKIPWYDRVGVAEVLVVDRDTAELRRWRRSEAGVALAEVQPDPDGWHRLTAVPMALRRDGDALQWRSDDGGAGEL